MRKEKALEARENANPGGQPGGHWKRNNLAAPSRRASGAATGARAAANHRKEETLLTPAAAFRG